MANDIQKVEEIIDEALVIEYINEVEDVQNAENTNDLIDVLIDDNQVLNTID